MGRIQALVGHLHSKQSFVTRTRSHVMACVHVRPSARASHRSLNNILWFRFFTHLLSGLANKKCEHILCTKLALPKSVKKSRDSGVTLGGLGFTAQWSRSRANGTPPAGRRPETHTFPQIDCLKQTNQPAGPGPIICENPKHRKNMARVWTYSTRR